jgi:hypothetical protein
MLLGGCASTLQVHVNAIADTSLTPPTKRYVLINANKDGNEDDLFFREFSAYFVEILADKGYQQVDSRDAADIEILFQYAVSDGRTGIHTFTHPIYEAIGGQTITFTETKTDSSGTTTTTKGSVHVPLQYQHVGTAVESHSYTVFTSSVALEAYLVNGAKTADKGGAPKVLWKTVVSSTSESNDLRAIMPVLATAASPYLTDNSGAQISVKMKVDDPKVLATKARAAPTP